MTDLTHLGPSAVDVPPASAFAATVRDNAAARGQEVRCHLDGEDPLRLTDPMPWNPVVDDGRYYPKTGDRALVVYPVNGPPVIAEWWPRAGAEPDAPLS